MKKILITILSVLMACSFCCAFACKSDNKEPLEAKFKTDVSSTGYEIGDEIDLENFIVKVDGAQIALKVAYGETFEEFTGENLKFTAKVAGEHTLTYTLTKDGESANNSMTFTVSESDPGGETTPLSNVTLVSGGKSQFKIVIPANPEKYDEFASEELQTLFKKATSCTLPIISDADVVDGGYYFSIGDTTLKANANITVTTQKDSGYRIELTDKVIYLVGNETKKSVGTLFAVYKFLNLEFNYVYYAEDVISIDKKVSDKKAYDIYDNYEYSPSLPGLAGRAVFGDEEGNLRYLVGQEFDKDGNPTRPALWPHNHLSVLPVSTYGEEHPDWYAANKLSLCLTNEDMMAEYAAQMVKYLDDHPDVEIFTMGAMDRMDKCNCTNCQASDALYTTTGTDLRFVNKVIELMEETFMQRDGYVKDFKVLTLNYYYTEDPPVKYNSQTKQYEALVVADERVIPHVCFYKADCSSNIESYDNIAAAVSFEGWKVVSDKFTSWLYQGYFDKYRLMFVDELPYIKNWASKLIEMNSSFDLVEYPNLGIFKELYSFVCSQVFYDINVDVDELIADFMNNYYGIVGADMLDVYNSLVKQIADYEKTHGNIYIDAWGDRPALYSKDLWTKEFLTGLQAKMDAMYKKVTDSELSSKKKADLNKKIGAIELFPRYWVLKFYGTELEATVFAEKAESVIKDAEGIYGYDTQYLKFDNIQKDIYTAQDFFDAMAIGFGKFTLKNDIDCSEYMAEHPWEGEKYIRSFSGELEGNNHKITGISGKDDGLVAVYGFIGEFAGSFNNVYMEIEVEMPPWNGNGSPFYGDSWSFGILADYFYGELNNCVFNIKLNVSGEVHLTNCGLVAYACRGSEFNNVLIIDSSTCEYAKYRTTLCMQENRSEYNITTNGVVYVRTAGVFGVTNETFDDGFRCLLPDAGIAFDMENFYIANSLEDANTVGGGYTLDDSYFESTNKTSNGKDLWVAPTGKAMDALTGITYEDGSVLLNGNVVYTED